MHVFLQKQVDYNFLTGGEQQFQATPHFDSRFLAFLCVILFYTGAGKNVEVCSSPKFLSRVSRRILKYWKLIERDSSFSQTDLTFDVRIGMQGI